MWSCLMDACVECHGRSLESFKRHRPRQIRHIEQLFGAPPADHAGGPRSLRAIQKREALFGLKLQRFDSDPFERFTASDCCGSAEDIPFANKNQSEMRERGEISTCPDAA